MSCFLQNLPGENLCFTTIKTCNDYKVVLMVAGVLVLMFPEGWPRAWHGSGVLPVAVFHANS